MSFDCLAPHYRWLEWALAGEKLQRCRTAFLAGINPPSRILLMGEGPGRFLETCVKQFPAAEIIVVDASLRMLNAARQRCARMDTLNSVRFVHCDLLDWDPGEEKFGLIATHFFLDCFPSEQLATVIRKLSALLSNDGAWLISDFKLPQSGWRRIRAQAIHAVMYTFFRNVVGLRAACVTCPDTYLAASGLRLEQRREWNWGLLHADLWRMAR